MFHPDHLRQLYAYLARTRATTDASARVDGVLLYPAITTEPTHSIDLGGFRVGVAHLPLNAPWSELAQQLESLLFSKRPSLSSRHSLALRP